ncbi:MAG TPA: VWA domain-containing protein [Kiritimatiellia bacterium]|nr:VWA domain-containing protein [Kiritimatiellia bacterium]HRU70035.1 VWA domain-containing protein [Kiritimatiellia bacterium]
MIPHGFGQHQRQGEHHMMLACVAVLLSAIIHVVCMYLFADWALGGTASGLRQKARDWFEGDRVPPMRVEMMRTDPMRIAEKVPGERDTPSRGPIEAGDQVEALSQSASPVLTVPPPIPREALAPGVPALKEVIPEQIDTTPWMPRQEIAQIFDRTVQDDVAALPRREIPMIERVPKAPDIVPSIDLAGRRFGKDPEPPKPMEAAEVFDTEISKGTFKLPVAQVPETAAKVSAGTTEARFGMQPGEKTGTAIGGADSERLKQAQQERVEKQLEEAARQTPAGQTVSAEERRAREAQAQIAALQETIDYVPIDDLLAVGLETFRDPAEPGRVYFRIGIQPRADKQVPVIAKDIVFVQDVSASMTEERMVFCRRGMAAALQTLNPGDRFNVVGFRDTFEPCFKEWAVASTENLVKAAAFVNGMRAFGQTDLFGSLRALMRLPRDPRRPMIAVVVTDGKPTFGVTESAKIIGEFSALNNGMISVYMFGTQSKANVYLLDMLTYCNRGTSTVMNGNRWDLPAAFQPVYEGVRYPVMGDITVVFDSASKCEVYPKNSTNLYKDRQLELCGVCPDTTEELVFQVRGLASDKGYDSIFRLSMSRHAKLGSAALKRRWANQKMYHLVAEYSREARQQVMAEMLKVHTQYGVPIPYESELK